MEQKIRSAFKLAVELSVGCPAEYGREAFSAIFHAMLYEKDDVGSVGVLERIAREIDDDPTLSDLAGILRKVAAEMKVGSE